MAPGKLSRAVRFLEGSARRPSMYCGRLTVTDVKLKAVGLSPVPRRPLSISNALVENVALGPTIVINARGRDLVARKLPDYAVMHDAWLYLVFSSLGQILYDIQPHLLYRVHDATTWVCNETGWPACTRPVAIGQAAICGNT